jgi:hypothetical protein
MILIILYRIQTGRGDRFRVFRYPGPAWLLSDSKHDDLKWDGYGYSEVENRFQTQAMTEVDARLEMSRDFPELQILRVAKEAPQLV